MVPLRADLQTQVRHSVWTRREPVYQRRVSSDLRLFMRRWFPESRVMDAGCGDGYAMDIMREAGHKPVGYDVNEAKLEEARKHGHEAVFCNLEEVAVEQPFDVVWCRHVVEHLINPTMALACFYQALRTDGVLSLIVPIVRVPTSKHPTMILSEEDVRFMVKDAGFSMSKSELVNKPYGDEVRVWAQRRG